MAVPDGYRPLRLDVLGWGGIRSLMVQTNGVWLRVAEAREPGPPVVVLCHGFPEPAFSWRHCG